LLKAPAREWIAIRLGKFKNVVRASDHIGKIDPAKISFIERLDDAVARALFPAPCVVSR
jgi:hypothetical protein